MSIPDSSLRSLNYNPRGIWAATWMQSETAQKMPRRSKVLVSTYWIGSSKGSDGLAADLVKVLSL
jgi:hypothetical protein